MFIITVMGVDFVGLLYAEEETYKKMDPDQIFFCCVHLNGPTFDPSLRVGS